MPDITLAPVLIDTSAGESGQKQTTSGFIQPYFQGPYKVGSNLYVVLQSQSFTGGPPPPPTINVFKSADGGLTWTQQDVANSPLFDTTLQLIRFSSRLNPDGVTITIAYMPNGTTNPQATLSWATFSTVTNLFTVGVIPDLHSTFAQGRGVWQGDWVVRTNGEILLMTGIIVAPNTAQTSMGYFLYSGGVWSTFNVIIAGNDGAQLAWDTPALVLDTTTGITHCFIEKRQLAVSLNNEFYFQTNGANVSTVPQQISVPSRPANDRPAFGRPVIWNGNVALPVYTVRGGGGTLQNMRVYLGTPLAAPVFTFTDLESATATQAFDEALGQFIVDGANLWAVWVHFPNHATIQILRSINGGSGWGATGVFYDLIANPPNVLPAASQGIFALTPGVIGSVGAIITVNDAALFNVVSYFLLQPPPPPATLTLVKTVSPGGGVAATAFVLSATGPTPISGAGGVGPSVVTPGVYILSETAVNGYQARAWSLAGGGTLVGNVLTLASGDVAVATIINDPIRKPTAGGGTYFPRFLNKTLLANQIARTIAPISWLYDFPNGNDLCLSREWRLYNQIDPTALSCARKPDCFCGEEGARPWVDPPPGAVTFNPDKAIPLPAPAAVNVVVVSFRVPIGFDGILLAQYHGYRGQGTFVEGSGDIIWRVRVNGRFLRDMGNMQLSIGSPQTLSPCPGGLWLHSGNLVEYIVSAPNGSGALPLPGQGNILAGLHGWFYPRI